MSRAPAAAVKNTKTAAAASPNERLLLTRNRTRILRTPRTSTRRRRTLTQRGSASARRAIPQLVSRDLQLVAIGIAEVNRMRDAMVLKVKSDSALFQFLLRSFKILSIRAQGKMEDTHRVGLA